MFLQILAQATNEILVSKPEALPEATDEMLRAGGLNLMFIAIAGISTIVLVIQGILYSLSAGEPEKTGKALSGIIYALVGLVVATTAWSLVNFTLDKVIRDVPVTSAFKRMSDPELNSTLTNLIGDIAGFIILISGIISVIMILVGAIRFNLSGGDSAKTQKARNMIIYALIGATLSVSAGPILVFVLDRL